MKKLILVLLTILFIISIYNDLKNGTLQTFEPLKATEKQQPSVIPYKIVIVSPGSTTISIVEQLHDGPLPVSIQQVEEDFQKLNDGLHPHAIKTHLPYKFPVYE